MWRAFRLPGTWPMGDNEIDYTWCTPYSGFAANIQHLRILRRKKDQLQSGAAPPSMCCVVSLIDTSWLGRRFVRRLQLIAQFCRMSRVQRPVSNCLKSRYGVFCGRLRPLRTVLIGGDAESITTAQPNRGHGSWTRPIFVMFAPAMHNRNM